MIKVCGQVIGHEKVAKKNREGSVFYECSLIILNTGSKFNEVVRVKEETYELVAVGEEVDIEVYVKSYVTSKGNSGHNLVEKR
jgi:hypothetical protein